MFDEILASLYALKGSINGVSTVIRQEASKTFVLTSLLRHQATECATEDAQYFGGKFRAE